MSGVPKVMMKMMRRPARLAAAAAVTAALLFGVGALSRVPYAVESGEEFALIRLSWRFRGNHERECRPLRPDELAAIPAHMRLPEVCERQVASFLLTVTLDGAPVALDTVRPFGARADRPLYVYREFRVRPGEHWLLVRFRKLGREPTDGEGDEGPERHEAQEEERAPSGPADPPALELEAQVRAAAREVILVTQDPSEQRLVVRRRGTPWERGLE